MAKTKEKKEGITAAEALANAAPTFGDFTIDRPIAVGQWRPEAGEKRAFELRGFEQRVGDNDTPYNIYYGCDLETGELFGFIGGGLFDYFVRENSIANGDKLGVIYKGMVELKGGGRAHQWEIYKLKDKK